MITVSIVLISATWTRLSYLVDGEYCYFRNELHPWKHATKTKNKFVCSKKTSTMDSAVAVLGSSDEKGMNVFFAPLCVASFAFGFAFPRGSKKNLLRFSKKDIDDVEQNFVNAKRGALRYRSLKTIVCPSRDFDEHSIFVHAHRFMYSRVACIYLQRSKALLSDAAFFHPCA